MIDFFWVFNANFFLRLLESLPLECYTQAHGKILLYYFCYSKISTFLFEGVESWFFLDMLPMYRGPFMSKRSPKKFSVQILFKIRKINLSIDFQKILPNLRYKYFTERDTDLNFYTFVPKFKDILLLKDWLLTRRIRWVIRLFIYSHLAQTYIKKFWYTYYSLLIFRCFLSEF